MTNNAKYFKMVDTDDYYVCEKSTPIPTAEEIVNRFKMHPACKNFSVVEITKGEFLQGINNILDEIADSALDVWEWSPNNKDGIHLWRFWNSKC